MSRDSILWRDLPSGAQPAGCIRFPSGGAFCPILTHRRDIDSASYYPSGWVPSSRSNPPFFTQIKLRVKKNSRAIKPGGSQRLPKEGASYKGGVRPKEFKKTACPHSLGLIALLLRDLLRIQNVQFGRSPGRSPHKLSFPSGGQSKNKWYIPRGDMTLVKGIQNFSASCNQRYTGSLLLSAREISACNHRARSIRLLAPRALAYPRRGWRRLPLTLRGQKAPLACRLLKDPACKRHTWYQNQNCRFDSLSVAPCTEFLGPGLVSSSTLA
jgi:hypothetical protein